MAAVLEKLCNKRMLLVPVAGADVNVTVVVPLNVYATPGFWYTWPTNTRTLASLPELYDLLIVN